ncbi:lactococcin 972 family bacteriocin [Bacillus subtilis]|uniref:Lactococcin 972 family bacteriocin n=2 Tax=Bacillus subtilis TaxID=1423 RepID=A0A0D1INU3_BACIU|nr:lactococcin 972 family bacteriocin [Bacillus subtilis]KAF2427886.1 hypothetical protein B6K89_02100 [Bacillus subtilis]KIN51002.1 hypothetical protein B4146_0458 [Bacillus subtilis]KIU10963.1 hypothetical protein SC09_Contig25orf00863 [Bacillus subtilis]KZD94327.1 hypothetical protein B4122_1023 [Bacillus subtilis]MBO3796628.1 hypothetical protein [Bacillus subtilis]
MVKKGLMSAALIAALALSTGQAASAAGAATSGEVDLTNTPLKNSEVTPFANENVGGGNWDYGTAGYFDWGFKKKVWSNYYHKDKAHASSCALGTRTNSSGKTKAGTTSYSDLSGGATDAKTKANWKTY